MLDRCRLLRSVDATWNGVSSLTGASWSYAWGSPGAIPVPGDYDGDGRTDLAVYVRRRRSVAHRATHRRSQSAPCEWGVGGDIAGSRRLRRRRQDRHRRVSAGNTTWYGCSRSGRAGGSAWGSRAMFQCRATSTATARRTSRITTRRPGRGGSCAATTVRATGPVGCGLDRHSSRGGLRRRRPDRHDVPLPRRLGRGGASAV